MPCRTQHTEKSQLALAGWYEFREKMMRGYAHLRVAQQGIDLEAEHPLQPKRFVS
jgi:hypothetical protein